MADDELSLPKATVHKLIKEMLPTDVRCANDTRELIINCCTEFIHLLASEANDACNKDGRRTIAPEHIIKSLKTLGFDDYLDEVTGVHENHKSETTKMKKAKQNNPRHNMTAEQLAQSQKELFAAARHRAEVSKDAFAPASLTPTSSDATSSIASSSGFMPSGMTYSMMNNDESEEEDYDEE